MQRRQFLAGLTALGISGYAGAQDQAAPTRGPDVIFVPTPDEIVDAMLKMAAVTAKDTVYDLGCGDGRIVITAAKKYGARGVGIDIDPERIKEANANVEGGRRHRQGALHPRRPVRGEHQRSDGRDALPAYRSQPQAAPKLMKDLNPGTRVVSHAFNMGDWKPEKQASIRGTTVYLWRIPPRTT